MFFLKSHRGVFFFSLRSLKGANKTQIISRDRNKVFHAEFEVKEATNDLLIVLKATIEFNFNLKKKLKQRKVVVFCLEFA